MSRPTSAREQAGGRIAVRPPALVEAAQGVREAARSAQDAAAALGRSVGSAAAFGGAEQSFASMGRAWIADLGLLVREVAELATRVESAAVDYVRTDVAAGGKGLG